MATLSNFNTDDKSFQLMQSQWQSILNPIISNPLVQGRLIQGQALKAGQNVINHKLGAKLQGWFIVDRDGTTSVYRSAPKDMLTLTLTASAAANVDIYVF